MRLEMKEIKVLLNDIVINNSIKSINILILLSFGIKMKTKQITYNRTEFVT